MHIPRPSETEFELPPAGTFLAVCYRVIDLGTQATTWGAQHKILISWELAEEKMTDGRPFTISQRYTWSMHEKATLRKHLEAWRGVPFTDADFGVFDIKNIIGAGCILNIVHTEKGEKRFANVASVARMMKGMKAPLPVNETVYLALLPDRWSPDTFQKLSQNLQGAIMQSPQYQELAGERGRISASPPRNGGKPELEHVVEQRSGYKLSSMRQKDPLEEAFDEDPPGF